ncbi:MAG: 1-acyl-sn-glycerol-3-phosphate acyltransferase [Fibrobacteria bacterium]|nr:1-acyl-sn-glycerol-3-phosphate acyltransferase [Fibrobacteria bacterium]
MTSPDVKPARGREPGRGALAHAVARLRAVTFLSATFGSVLLVGFWLVPLAVLFRKPSWLKTPCRAWVRGILPLMGVRVRLEGAHHLEDPTPRLFVANHQSFVDIPLMMGWVRWPSFLAKKEIASWPWFGSAMRLLQCVFVDRSDRHSRTAASRAVRGAMDHGIDFCIFPEGTRSPDGELLPLRPGAFQIALDSGALLTPVVIDPTWRILNKKGYRMWAGEVVVSILAPIATTGEGAPDRKALAQIVEDSMRAELHRLRDAA